MLANEKPVNFYLDIDCYDKMRQLLPHGSQKQIFANFSSSLVAFLESTENPRSSAALIANGTIGISFNDPR